MIKLIIGNRAYSSWSMRGWLAVKHSGEEFEEIVVPLFDEEWDKRREGDEFAPSLGKVPILWDGDCVVWDSLAIIEFLADRHGKEKYWPEDDVGLRHGPLDGRRNALRLRQSAPRAADERAQDLPVQAAGRRGPQRDRAHPPALGAGARAFRRRPAVPVRRMVRRGHHVRAGRHALHHLCGPDAALRRALHEGGAVASRTSTNGSTRPRTSPGSSSSTSTKPPNKACRPCGRSGRRP